MFGVYVYRSDEYVDDVYAVTLNMSTYLLAFIVGDFEHKEKYTDSGLLYRVWAQPASLEQTNMALDVGVSTIVNYEKYFGITFPLEKQGLLLCGATFCIHTFHKLSAVM